jgi:putative peptidoglycan lipid II flippase
MNLLKSLAAVSSITMISRVLGFVRDTIIARIFGAGVASDAFFVAFKLPNLLRRIFAEGAFSQAFVPILAEYKQQQGEEAARTFVAYVSGMLTLVLAVVSLLGVLAAPWIVWVTAPGFADEAERFELTTDLLRITFPYILLISLSSLAGAILNTWNRFAVPAFVPTLLNRCMIGFALFLTPYFDPPIMVLGWAVLAGGLAQLLYQLPHLKKIGMLVLPRLNLRDSGVWRVMKLMGPAILGVSVAQISLSKSVASQNPEEYSRLLDWGLRLCFLLVLPCALALALLAEPLTVSLFQYGQFSAHDAQMTQRALMAYSVGLLGLILIKVLAPGFYARQNIRTPVRIAMFTLAMTQVMNVLFVFVIPLAHAGLALAIGLAACLNAGLLYWRLRVHDLFQPQPGWGRFLAKLVVAVLAMVAVLLGVMQVMPAWDQGGMLLRFARLGVLVGAGVLVYFGVLAVLGFRVRDFARRAV